MGYAGSVGVVSMHFHVVHLLDACFVCMQSYSVAWYSIFSSLRITDSLQVSETVFWLCTLKSMLRLYACADQLLWHTRSMYSHLSSVCIPLIAENGRELNRVTIKRCYYPWPRLQNLCNLCSISTSAEADCCEYQLPVWLAEQRPSFGPHLSYYMFGMFNSRSTWCTFRLNRRLEIGTRCLCVAKAHQGLCSWEFAVSRFVQQPYLQALPCACGPYLPSSNQ